jgi:trigger factor
MATITRENIGLLNEKIVVKVEKDDYLPSFEKAIKNYSKNANIPGFRKGMVPVGMVKKMYGTSVFADEVIKSVEKGLTDYMTNEKLEIFAQPLPLPENDSKKLDMNQPDEYAFAFEVGLKPEFSLPDLAQAHLTRYKVIVTDEVVNQEVERIQYRLGSMTQPESVASEENELDLAFAELDAEGNEVPDLTNKVVSQVPVNSFAPHVRADLMGKEAGDSLTLQLLHAFEESEKESIARKLEIDKDDAQAWDKTFKVTITKVSLLEKAILNEEMYSNYYPDRNILTEEDFRNEVRNDIQAQWDSQSRNQLQDQIYHQLIDHTQIDFPEDFLKRWMMTSGEKPRTPEEVQKEYPTFQNQLKWTLIVDKIVNENKIEVKPEDIREFAKQQLLGYMSGQFLNLDQPWVDDYLNKMLKDKKYVEDSFHRIQTERVFAWTETQVQPTEAPVSEEEFKNIVESHHHHH